MSKRVFLLVTLLTLTTVFSASPIPSTTKASPVQQDQIVASLKGYQLNVHAFSFENYSEGKVGLTSAEMRRMFGDKVCATLDGEQCLLTPPVEQLMDSINSSMDGGHCEGMAVLTLLFYQNKLKVTDFNGDKPFTLQLDNNEKLQREIAFWFMTQDLEPTRNFVKLTPNEVIDKLIEDFTSGKEAYTIGIYKPDGSDGHAVTPYAVQDKGNGIFWILVYDNNFPGTSRAVEVNRDANKWSYVASTNPSEPGSLYEGDATTKTLEIVPNSTRLQPQVCPVCEESGTSKTIGRALLAAPSTSYNEIWLEGKGDLLIMDAQGRRMGLVNGKLLKEIPGATYTAIRSGNLWQSDPNFVYYIPTGVKFTVTVDGSRLKKTETSNVVLIGPGYDIAVDEIKVNPNQKDTIEFAPDGSALTYTTTSDESPVISFGFDGHDADFAFYFKGVELVGGGTIGAKLDKTVGKISINTKGNKNPGTYIFAMDRFTPKAEESFESDEITLEPGDTITLNYGKWEGSKNKLTMELDEGSTGKVSETIELEPVK